MAIEDKKHTTARLKLGIIYGIIALIGLLAARFFPVLALMPACPFRVLSGLPCPSCGATRSMVHLAHGQFSAALAMNPLAPMLVMAAIMALVYDFLVVFSLVPEMSIRLSGREASYVRGAAILILLANWLYLCLYL